MTIKHSSELFKPHLPHCGGVAKGYKFLLCPECGKYGVSSRVISPKLIRKVCRYCYWIEGVNKEVRRWE